MPERPCACKFASQRLSADSKPQSAETPSNEWHWTRTTEAPDFAAICLHFHFMQVHKNSEAPSKSAWKPGLGTRSGYSPSILRMNV